MNLAQLISRIPKPILVIGVLALALAFFIYNEPLKDECVVKSTLFTKELRGILFASKLKKGTQFAQLRFWKERCREGNSIGACEDYFTGLRKIVTALRTFPEKCEVKYAEDNENFIPSLIDGVVTMALVAWGEKPPAGISERAGWLTEADVKTFCGLKNHLSLLVEDERFIAIRNRVYSTYPDAWPEKVDISDRLAENRPKAYKTAENPTGTLDRQKIFERSLFSIPCDMYQ